MKYLDFAVMVLWISFMVGLVLAFLGFMGGILYLFWVMQG